jgi:hypothetical protein
MILNDVVATVSTKNRTQTTLPLVLTSILCSTYKPGKLVVYDDNDTFTNPLENEIYKNILTGLLNIGVNWFWLPGEKRGQIHNHEKARVDYTEEFVWRIDDDNILCANVLEELYKAIIQDNKIGAVGPSILDPKNTWNTPLASNGIKDIKLGINVQWNFNKEAVKVIEVDHLQGSTFLYRRAAAKHGYEKKLSRVAHREETIFTYEMKRAGWRLLVLSGVNTWHMRYGTGGIRDHNIKFLFDSDEVIFQKKLAEWGVKFQDYKFIYLDNGMGDHYAFKSILPEILEKYKNTKIIIGACTPGAFWDINHPNVLVTSMKEIASFVNADEHNLYKFMFNKSWTKPVADAFRAIYL